jgi:hypothetical protein
VGRGQRGGGVSGGGGTQTKNQGGQARNVQRQYKLRIAPVIGAFRLLQIPLNKVCHTPIKGVKGFKGRLGQGHLKLKLDAGLVYGETKPVSYSGVHEFCY